MSHFLAQIKTTDWERDITGQRHWLVLCLGITSILLTACNVYNGADWKISIPSFESVVVGNILEDDDGDGFPENVGDCDDSDGAVNPLATEICSDGIDQDCEGTDPVCDESDEADGVSGDDVDDDGDGFSENASDCDDSDANIYPDADCGRCTDHSDTTPPSVASHSPKAGETDVDPLDSNFEFKLVFSEQVMTDFIGDDILGDFRVHNDTTGQFLSGVFTYKESSEGSTRLFTFDYDLDYCSIYTVIINENAGITDENCNVMETGYSWTFSTREDDTCSTSPVIPGTGGSVDPPEIPDVGIGANSGPGPVNSSF
jgi:hypothetical protein